MNPRISLLPLDVGFDLRAHNTPVSLSDGVSEVAYLDQDGKEAIAAGSREEICKALHRAGYTIEPCQGDCQGCQERAPGECIIDGQYEFYCQKHGFSPRRPFHPTKKLDLNGPWTVDRGQLRDKDGNALASFPIHPGGLGGPEDSRNGELCALLPQMVDTLAALVDRCDHAPILAGNEGLRGPLLAEAKTLLHKIGIEKARPKPGATWQGWLSYRGVPMVLVAESKDTAAHREAIGLLLREGRERGNFPEA